VPESALRQAEGKLWCVPGAYATHASSEYAEGWAAAEPPNSDSEEDGPQLTARGQAAAARAKLRSVRPVVKRTVRPQSLEQSRAVLNRLEQPDPCSEVI
jgi:hypothetical protein